MFGSVILKSVGWSCFCSCRNCAFWCSDGAADVDIVTGDHLGNFDTMIERGKVCIRFVFRCFCVFWDSVGGFRCNSCQFLQKYATRGLTLAAEESAAKLSGLPLHMFSSDRMLCFVVLVCSQSCFSSRNWSDCIGSRSGCCIGAFRLFSLLIAFVFRIDR